MRDVELHCDTCQGVATFEVPPCVDGHGANCPELVCTGCGSALVVVPLGIVIAGPRARTTRADRRSPRPPRRGAGRAARRSRRRGSAGQRPAA